MIPSTASVSSQRSGTLSRGTAASSASPPNILSGPPELAEAAGRVLQSFRDESGDAIDGADVERALTVLVGRVAAHRQAPAPDPLTDRSLATTLTRRLLELLRAELVRAWQSAERAPHPNDMLVTLGAIEATQREIAPAWSEYFTSRLTGPGALDLVVEIAHDLRSPLTSILFLAETLQKGHSGEVNELQRRQLGLIYGAALGLSSVTSDVMELARGGDRLVDKEPAPFSVTEILDSVRDIVRPIAEEKGLDVVVTPPESDHRMGHALALSRVLLNLTTNALKFTDEGSVEVTATPRGPNRLVFSVKDTGRGIAPDALDSLFQPFRRTRARREYCFSGTGLGLTICRKLVQAMGSTLELDTSPEQGTRFHFEVELPPSGGL